MEPDASHRALAVRCVSRVSRAILFGKTLLDFERHEQRRKVVEGGRGHGCGRRCLTGGGLRLGANRPHARLSHRASRASLRTASPGWQFWRAHHPRLQLYANEVTVGEDPAFGYEYFLRAEHLSAGLRWSGLLRGHFEFGTLSFSRPSLILVRSSRGQWNLERWLPPAKSVSAQTPPIYGPPSPAPPTAVAASGTSRRACLEFFD